MNGRRFRRRQPNLVVQTELSFRPRTRISDRVRSCSPPRGWAVRVRALGRRCILATSAIRGSARPFQWTATCPDGQAPKAALTMRDAGNTHPPCGPSPLTDQTGARGSGGARISNCINKSGLASALSTRALLAAVIVGIDNKGLCLDSFNRDQCAHVG